MPGQNIHRPGRKVPTRGRADKRVGDTATRRLANAGRRERIFGGYDPRRVSA
jgi:hypothetical protein